ncbi:hypothetical protein, partial [Pseudomonas sp. BAV 2493]|uniref:hypothetical protein n=1 Tax=Pseudomonas sp. BAV 2493 TaxID=2654187 RepID=UPI001C49BA2A
MAQSHEPKQCISSRKLCGVLRGALEGETRKEGEKQEEEKRGAEMEVAPPATPRHTTSPLRL